MKRFVTATLLVFVGAVLLGIAFAVYRVSSARTAGSGDVACMNRLYLLEKAILECADAHNGLLPSSLELLVDKGFTEEGLRCPVSGDRYIYFLEGQAATADDLKEGACLLADRGAPYVTGPPHKNVKCWHGYSSVTMGHLVERLDAEPGRLAELLEPEYLRQRE